MAEFASTASDDRWLPVIARSLAYLALHHSGARDESVSAQANFLAALGLQKEDIAPLVGSTEDSVRVMLGTTKRAGGKSSGKKGTTSGKRQGPNKR